ncbi:hypothetical protein [Ensifer adhaerens]|uniref:hypothetical protein n=1 Tax=Ensifer adhaerens TaxID=106592 RepID=UPI001F1F7883|nr:hypothetical protein [Ensifer adhaerens]
MPPPLTALRGRSHGSNLNGNYAPNRLSSEWKPTISHQRVSLERNLGSPLFLRLPGRVELSREGAVYFPVVQEALDKGALTTDLIRQSNAPTSTVQVYVTIAVRWRIPRRQTFKGGGARNRGQSRCKPS